MFIVFYTVGWYNSAPVELNAPDGYFSAVVAFSSALIQFNTSELYIGHYPTGSIDRSLRRFIIISNNVCIDEIERYFIQISK